MTIEKLYEKLITEGYFEEETLDILTSVNGFSVSTLEDAIYVKYGLRTYEDLLFGDN